MDSGGGPGPPRPADIPPAQLPPAQDGNLNMFPFNAPATQQQPPLGIQIAPNRNAMTVPAPASGPVTSAQFMANIPQRTVAGATALNRTQQMNPQANMLHHINAVAGASQSVPMQPQPGPENLQQQQTNDFFGELQKALAVNSNQQSSAEEGVDVLDNALALAMARQPVSQPHQATAPNNLAARHQPQLQQQIPDQLQQLQLQHQMQQERIRQQRLQHQYLQQRQFRQQQQQQALLQQQQQRLPQRLAPGQLSTPVIMPGNPAQGTPTARLPHQSIGLAGQVLQEDLSRAAKTKVPRKAQPRRPRSKSQAKASPDQSPQMPSTLLPGPPNQTTPSSQNAPQPIQASIQGQLQFSSHQPVYQHSPPQLQQSPQQDLRQTSQQGLQNNVLRQQLSSHFATAVSQPSVALTTMHQGNAASNHLQGARLQPAQSRGVLNVGIQDAGQLGAHRQQGSGTAEVLTAGHAPQRYPRGNPALAQFDAAALESVMRSSKDPKIRAAVQQQLDYLRHLAAAERAKPQAQAQGQAGLLVTSPAGMGRDLSNLQPHVQSQSGPAGTPLQVSQAALLQRQQLMQKQHVFKQQQQQQELQQQQMHLRNHGSIPQNQRLDMPKALSQGISLAQHPTLQAQANQNLNSLPPHVRQQIQAQLQAPQLRTQARAQHSQSSHSQSASQGAPSDTGGDVQPSGTQNSHGRRPRRSPRGPSKNGVVQGNGAPGASPGTSVHAGQSTGVPSALLPNSVHDVQTGNGSHLSGQHPQSQPHSRKNQGRERSQAEIAAHAAQAAQIAAVRAANANVGRADGKRLAEEHKRLAREAELNEIAEQKKRRLHAAPWNDYQRVLAPDYATPFSGVIDAWTRLLPYHVLLGDEEVSASQEEWDKEVEKLGTRYKDCFRSLRKTWNRFCDAKYEPVSKDASLPGHTVLTSEDSMAMEFVLLQDHYETARKQAIIANQKAAVLEARRAAEAVRHAKEMEERRVMAAQAAAEESMRSEQERNAQRFRMAQASSSGPDTPRSDPANPSPSESRRSQEPSPAASVSKLSTGSDDKGGGVQPVPRLQQNSSRASPGIQGYMANTGLGSAGLPPLAAQNVLRGTPNRSLGVNMTGPHGSRPPGRDQQGRFTLPQSHLGAYQQPQLAPGDASRPPTTGLVPQGLHKQPPQGHLGPGTDSQFRAGPNPGQPPFNGQRIASAQDRQEIGTPVGVGVPGVASKDLWRGQAVPSASNGLTGSSAAVTGNVSQPRHDGIRNASGTSNVLGTAATGEPVSSAASTQNLSAGGRGRMPNGAQSHLLKSAVPNIASAGTVNFAVGSGFAPIGTLPAFNAVSHAGGAVGTAGMPLVGVAKGPHPEALAAHTVGADVPKSSPSGSASSSVVAGQGSNMPLQSRDGLGPNVAGVGRGLGMGSLLNADGNQGKKL